MNLIYSQTNDMLVDVYILILQLRNNFKNVE